MYHQSMYFEAASMIQTKKTTGFQTFDKGPFILSFKRTTKKAAKH